LIALPGASPACGWDEAAPIFCATAPPRMNPRLSIPMTTSMPWPTYGRRQRIDRGLEAQGVAQQRGDVVEEDPRLGEVRDVTNVLFKVHGVCFVIFVCFVVLFGRKTLVGPERLFSSTNTSSNASAPRSTPDRGLNALDRLGLAFDKCLDAAVRQVAHPSRDTFALRCLVVNHLKPTPWTRPLMISRRATRIRGRDDYNRDPLPEAALIGQVKRLLVGKPIPQTSHITSG
jgi:hypothetical protein